MEEERKEEDQIEEDIYGKEGAKEQVEGDEIDGVEEGFMAGYNEDIKNANCASCGKVLERDGTVEETLNGKTYYFCCETCARKFELKKDHY